MSERSIYAVVGQTIQEMRAGLGMSQAQLAESIGLGTSSVSQIESGKQAVSLQTLARVARALGVRIQDMLP